MKVYSPTVKDGAVMLPDRRAFVRGVWVDEPARALLFNGSEWVAFEADDRAPDDWSKWADAIPDALTDRVTLPAGDPRKRK